ncbi:hypothetical protein DID88_006649 [Monilinia fructigena]|uniref:Electron transfer flavoprotein-ubiquinone oxidoreductase n=1 Tax=Monilinia fructigena TaxID=38457 RepID=A0A395IGY6_9HELO|nr:hypothetical protein DID88_006649 [Monilinia fructigena]
MSSSRAVTACLQRNVIRQNVSRIATQCPRILQQSFIYPASRPRIASSLTAGQRRAFSLTVPRRLADVNDDFDLKLVERESDEVDVCIVGGGPSGLSAAIRLKQLANEAGNEDFRVILLEKAGEIGAHILSGAVIEPTAINELFPDWLAEDNENKFENVTPVSGDKMRFLTKGSSIPIPAPPQMNNHGNYIVSLNQFTKWLGDRAEEVGVEVYPGFAGAEVLYKPDGSVKGVATNDLGIARSGKPKESFERGMEFHAKVTLFAEGCHGSLTKQVIKKFDLRRDSQPQTYGLGIKERVANAYHMELGLSTKGGFQSIPKCAFPGGALIGDTAGFLNVPKIKGTHTAMKSGMLAAEATWTALEKPDEGSVFLFDYEDSLRKSYIWKELKEVRNMRPSFHSPLKLYGGIMYSGLEAYILKGKVPWTLKHKSTDAAATKLADECPKIEYEKPDGKISFDILTSVSRTGTNHEEDQPVHLQVKDWDKHAEMEYPKYKGIENRFCPAGVYEYVEDSTKDIGVRFQINAQNCIHCKTCDIKVPDQDINWSVPEGSGGPKYYMT